MHTWRLHQQASTSLLVVHGKIYASTTTSPPAAAAVPQMCRALRLLVTWSHRPYLTTSRGATTRGPDYTGSTAPMPRVWVPRHVARLVVDYSSSTTSPTSRVRVPLHVARLVTRLIAPLVVDYSASRRLVVDYFASAVRPGASARRAARHAACRTARRRLLRLTQARHRLLRLTQLVVDYFCLRRASGCLGTSCGSSRGSSRRSSSTTPPRAGSSSTTSPTPRVCVPRHVARLISRRLLLRLAQARRRLLRLRPASGRSSSTTRPRAGSSSTTSLP
jgi:hypothetical protein